MACVEEPFAVRRVEGKGLGMVANRDIAKGSRLLAESPILQISAKERAQWKHRMQNFFMTKRVPADFEAFLLSELDKRPTSQREIFWSLADAHAVGEKSATGIWHTNAFALGSFNGDAMGVLSKGCRINHSCTPNTVYSWQDDYGQHFFHAICDIGIDQEITISYISLTARAGHRQFNTQKLYQFNCQCECCCLETYTLHESDERRKRMGEIIRHVNNLLGEPAMNVESAAHGMDMAAELVMLIDEELDGNTLHKAQAYYVGAKVAMMSGHVEELDSLLTLAQEQALLVVGSDGDWQRIFGMVMTSDEEQEQELHIQSPTEYSRSEVQPDELEGLCSDSSGIPTRLKEKFKQSIWNRQPRLNFHGLWNFLRKGRRDISECDARLIFDQVDTENVGSIHFDDLVDFLYATGR